jgi:hypothetical protein
MGRGRRKRKFKIYHDASGCALVLRGQLCSPEKRASQESYPVCFQVPHDMNEATLWRFRELDGVITSLRLYLMMCIQVVHRPAIVFDIDETAILHVYDRRRNILDMSREYRSPHAYAIYRLARDLGIDVYFVSARSEQYNSYTHDTLIRHGYNDYSGLFTKPTKGLGDLMISVFKYHCRQSIITDYGHTLILNVGDQWSDLALNSCAFRDIDMCVPMAFRGAQGEIAVKFPNKYYMIP